MERTGELILKLSEDLQRVKKEREQQDARLAELDAAARAVIDAIKELELAIKQQETSPATCTSQGV